MRRPRIAEALTRTIRTEARAAVDARINTRLRKTVATTVDARIKVLLVELLGLPVHQAKRKALAPARSTRPLLTDQRKRAVR